MQHLALRDILEQVRSGSLDPDAALEVLSAQPAGEDLGFAVLDHHRALRKGFPEVIFGQGKSAEQIAILLERIHARGHNAFATRVSEEKARQVQERLPGVMHHTLASALTLEGHPIRPQGRGTIAVVTAGTSDLPVAEEAALTVRMFGHTLSRITDVGVAGIHRLLARSEALRSAEVLIVVAGMEGALPSVVAGLVDRPVIAVPTSVGYGASFHGLAALLAMLNSCASGVTVVNIDNGFGAGYAACLMNRDGAR